MAAVRNSLKNRFISVNNNFSSTLSSAIGIGSQDISLVDTPTKLGNFGYITVDNSLGGQIIFFSNKSGNILTTVRGRGGRSQDGTVAQAAGGGSIVQQRVIAANVSQIQGAVLSVLQADHIHTIGSVGEDPNRDQFVLADNGYTGSDKISIKSVIVNSTSAEFSIGRDLKKAFDKYYVNRMRASGNVLGSNMAYNLSIANLQGHEPYSIENYSATSDIASSIFNSLNLGSTNYSIFNVPGKTGGMVDEGIYYSSYLSSLWRDQPTPLHIHRKDIIFINRQMNPLGLLNSASGNVSQTSLYGLQMNTSVNSLQNKVQLFNVRPASIYQPYTVVSTHHDSRIDSQLLRKDSDFFMSAYDSLSSEATTGGKLTLRRSVGSGISGDRWAVSYNNNLLVDGSCFKIGVINQAVSRFQLYTGKNITSGSLSSVSALQIITRIFQTVVDRGWAWIATNSRSRYDSVQQGSQINGYSYVCLRSGAASLGFNNHISQFISYSQSNDKIGKFNLSFYGSSGQTPGSGIKLDSDILDNFAILLIPIVQNKNTNDYQFQANQRKYAVGSSRIKQTSITGLPGQLYSVPMDFDFSSVTGTICGFFVNIGFNGIGSGTSNKFTCLTQIKLQQGLQRTRFVQNKRERIVSKISYDSIRSRLGIQANSYNGDNLWISNKSYRDTISQTASINFGKNIPIGTQSDDPYISITANTFFSQASSAQYDNSYGASLRLSSATSGIINSKLLQYSSYTQQKFGLVNLGRQIAITHALNSDSLYKRTNGILLRTFDYTNGSTTGNLGNILIEAAGSSRSKLLMYSNSDMINISNNNLRSSRNTNYVKHAEGVPLSVGSFRDTISSVSSLLRIQAFADIFISNGTSSTGTVTGYLTNSVIVNDSSTRLIDVQISYILHNGGNTINAKGNLTHQCLYVSPGSYSYILSSSTSTLDNGGFGQGVSYDRLTRAYGSSHSSIMIFFEPHSGTLPGFSRSHQYYKIAYKSYRSANTDTNLYTGFKIRRKSLSNNNLIL